LKVRDANATRHRLRDQLTAKQPRQALPSRRGGREDVVETDHVALDRDLTARHDFAVALQHMRRERHRCVDQSLAVGLALRER